MDARKGGACAGRGHLDGPGRVPVRGACVRWHVVVVVLRACLHNASPRAGHRPARSRGGHGFRKLRIGKGVVAHVAIVTQSAPGYLPRSMPACCTTPVRYPCRCDMARISARYPHDNRYPRTTRTDIAISAHVRAHIHRTSIAHPDSRMCGAPPCPPPLRILLRFN